MDQENYNLNTKTALLRCNTPSTMKFTPDKMDTQAITGAGAGWLAVDGKKFEHSIVLAYNGLLETWDCPSFAALTETHLQALSAHDCEVLILGTGNQSCFVHPAWLQPFMARGIGVECMRTDAACRTYNLLANEGRKVVAALIVEG